MKISKNIIIIAIIIFINYSFSNAQNVIRGAVQTIEHEHHEHHHEHHTETLVNANVYWKGTTRGTITDHEGHFELERKAEDRFLVISFTGYKNDTLEIKENDNDITITMVNGAELSEIVVKGHVKGSYVSTMKSIKTEVISTAGIQKLACCNLSESFENSATVDVGYADAVSGAKQIKMLGLAGKYTRILTEKIPAARGLNGAFGLDYIPGSWMKSIQISKGAASVSNGYESMTGQINVEYKKPVSKELLHINLYANHYGKLEGNINSAFHISDKWSTISLLHASWLDNPVDDNSDGFLDMPKSKQINVSNRWKYAGEHLSSHFGIAYINEKRNGGQTNFYKENTSDKDYYGLEINTRHLNFYSKTGIRFHRPSTSIGIIASYDYLDRDAFFGNNQYTGQQYSLFANFIFQTYIFSTAHTINPGLSYKSDVFSEDFNSADFSRNESVPGAFIEYTYSLPEKFTFIAGIRLDENSEFGTFVTPRLHLKYSPFHNFTMRGSVGKGYRTANVFTEQIGILSSSREFIFEEEFKAEEAWNMGMNITKIFDIDNNRSVTLTLDAYRTSFINQVIVDLDQNTREVHFYNLNGDSYANSYQMELSAEPVKRLEITTAFRINDVWITLNDKFTRKPLVSKYKGLLSVSYATNHDKWKFSFTGLANGKSRLPDTSQNPEEYSLDEYSPVYYILHAQITKMFKFVEIYAGGENLTDFKQENPIIAADDPFSDYFDSSMVWGPVSGRKFYVGLRYTFTK